MFDFCCGRAKIDVRRKPCGSLRHSLGANAFRLQVCSTGLTGASRFRLFGDRPHFRFFGTDPRSSICGSGLAHFWGQTPVPGQDPIPRLFGDRPWDRPQFFGEGDTGHEHEWECQVLKGETPICGSGSTRLKGVSPFPLFGDRP